MKRAIIICTLFCAIAMVGNAQGAPAQETSPKPLPTIAEKTKGMEKFSGFFTDYWDAREGKIWLQIDRWNTDFLYVESLATGVGSNDIGLDRGQPGETQVVRFERSGPRVLLVAQNESYRAVTDDAAERRAVKESFAQSVLWGFTVAAADGDTVLVDATPFFERDAHGIAAQLEATKQGEYKIDPSRSAIYLPRTKNFPENTDVESTVTFAGAHPGRWVREVTPNPLAITVREHFSFIQAPPPGFHMRAYDPRCGFFDVDFMDFSTPVDQSLTKRYIAHWRLQKKDPSAAVSEPVKPIVYYVDRAMPQPIRSAVMEGAELVEPGVHGHGIQERFSGETASTGR